MRRYICFVWLLMAVLSSYAQTETGVGGRFYRLLTDSLKFTGIVRPTECRVEKDSVSYMEILANSRMKAYDMDWLGRPVYSPMPVGLGFSADVPVVGWESGAVVGNLDQAYMPGLMAVNSGSLGILQHFGTSSAYLGGIVNRYGFYSGGIIEQLGINGRITVPLSDRISATAFGTYFFGKMPTFPGSGFPLTPAALGFYTPSHFGGFADIRINEHWGVEAGAQAVRRYGTDVYDAEPIGNPYYLLNAGEKNVKISLPVGQILYHIIKGR